jgi:Flp pilus assembly protein TadD
VPVSIADNRPYVERWNDSKYLNRVIELGKNIIYQGEVMQALSELRSKADTAKSPEELRGMQLGIALLKSLLTCSERAQAKINKGADLDGLKAMGEDSLG